jgi:hypothetical protein
MRLAISSTSPGNVVPTRASDARNVPPSVLSLIARRSARAALIALCLPAGAALAQGESGDGLGSDGSALAMYRLLDAIPYVTRAVQPSPFRLETSTSIAPGHELRFSSATLSPGLAGATPGGDPGLRFDSRATYRYTFLEQNDWALKVGITAPLRDSSYGNRSDLPGDRPRLGYSPFSRTYQLTSFVPMMHLAGEGRVSERWRFNVDADTLWLPRSRGLDLGLRVNYFWAPNFSIFGGYRLSDFAADLDEPVASGLTNAANIGVRYRF